MKEWGIPFHVIENNWTQRQFDAMTKRLTERWDEERRAHNRSQKDGGARGRVRMKYKDAVQQGMF